MKLATLVEHLTVQLGKPLPGPEAQLSLMSVKNLQEYEKRFKELEKGYDIHTARQSSVLILLYEKEGTVFLPLIKRPEYEGVHSGQIAFPGGKVEPDDTDVEATALRETFEEIGVPSDQIIILGKLTPVFIPPSRFWVNVVLGYATNIPDFIPDNHEVAQLIEFPLDHLWKVGNLEERTVTSSPNWKMNAPGYLYQEHFIWGATSMILTELRELIQSNSQATKL
jgi:8-oxo-dGTP pyrophosphatase MutT (NUDIX family)